MDRQSDDGMSNPLWDYSVATYRLDEVAQLCLGLQDALFVGIEQGVDCGLPYPVKRVWSRSP